jgi:outer membrane protein assembly factor BamB
LRPRRLDRTVPRLVFALTALVAATPGAAAVTSEAWTQFQGSALHTGTFTNGPVPPYRSAWTTSEPTGGPRGAYGLSPPIVVEGLAIAVGPDYVVGVDVSTGTQEWSIPRALGPSVAPASVSAGGRHLLLFTEGWGSGPPDASATATATLTTTTPSFPATATPSVAEPTRGHASTTTSPSTETTTASPSGSPGVSQPGATDSHLVAVDLRSQQRVWSLALPDVSRTGVTVDTMTAFVGTIEGTVTAVDVGSGNVRWASATGGFLDQPIAAGDDLAIVSARGDRNIRAAVVGLREADGSEAWRYQPVTTTTVIGSASVGVGVGYVSLTDATVRSFDLATGSERWSARLNSIVFLGGPPVVVDDGVIVTDAGGQVYRLDAATGDHVWDFALNESVLRTSPVVIDDVLVLGTAAGGLDGFDLGTGDLIWRGPLGDGPTRGLGVSESTLVAVRAGGGIGFEGFTADPAGSLIRERSPTIVDAPRLAGSWAVAAIPLVVLVLLLGRFLWPRLGPVTFPQYPAEENAQDGEPEGEAPDDGMEP